VEKCDGVPALSGPFLHQHPTVGGWWNHRRIYG